MFFAPRMWLFVIASTIICAFIAMEFWVTSMIIISPAIATAIGVDVLFLGVVMALICFGMLTIYIGWVMQYYYFFKLRRLLKAYTSSGAPAEYQTPTGELYSITGNEWLYLVIQSPAEGSTDTLYHIGADRVSAQSVHSSTELTISDTYLGERELINTNPVALDKRRAFRHLARVLEASMSTNT